MASSTISTHSVVTNQGYCHSSGNQFCHQLVFTILIQNHHFTFTPCNLRLPRMYCRSSHYNLITCEVLLINSNCLKSSYSFYSNVSSVCCQTWKLIFIVKVLWQITAQTVFKLQLLRCTVWTRLYICSWCKILEIYHNIALKYIWSIRKWSTHSIFSDLSEVTSHSFSLEQLWHQNFHFNILNFGNRLYKMQTGTDITWINLRTYETVDKVEIN